MRKLLEETSERAISYLENLESRSVAPSQDAIGRIKELDESFPKNPTAPEDVVELLDKIASPATIASAGPRFFGFVIGGSLPAALASNWLAGAWDQNSALYEVTPATARIEQVALNWLLDIFQLPVESGGAFVTGATIANFSVLAAARNAVLSREGWNVEAEGLCGSPNIQVIVGEEAHPTLFKSLGLLGLGRERVIRVPVDHQGRMRPDSLPRQISKPAIVCLRAGNVNTGAFDPFEEIIPRAHEAGAWVHIDGAFGLWALSVPSLNHLTTGITSADSWATDAHKWLNVPYDSGLAFVRDADALRAAMSITAEYLPTSSDQRNPSDFTPELSRRARGIEIWAALKSLGRSGLMDLVERNCRQAKRFAQGFTSAGYKILNDVVLNQVLVSFGNENKTNQIIKAIQGEGTSWCGGTIWQGHSAMRISVSSWATTDDDVERSLEAMLQIAKSHNSGG